MQRDTVNSDKVRKSGVKAESNLRHVTMLKIRGPTVAFAELLAKAAIWPANLKHSTTVSL
jgi:hypothetical protein